jgi:hypothetical protein
MTVSLTAQQFVTTTCRKKSAIQRVTRLGEFSPNGRLFLEVAQILGFFLQIRLYINWDKKWLWLNFGRFFSQIHLVTLLKGS